MYEGLTECIILERLCTETRILGSILYNKTTGIDLKALNRNVLPLKRVFGLLSIFYLSRGVFGKYTYKHREKTDNHNL